MSLRNGSVAGTYIVATPASYVTSEVLYTGTGTLSGPSPISTVQPVGTTPGTIIVATPAPRFVTSRVVYTGTEALTGETTLSTVAASGTTPGTYIVASPASIYVTSTVVYTGSDTISEPTVISTVPPVGTRPGTIILAARYVTSLVDYQGTVPITGPTAISTVGPSGTAPGTFIIATQAAIFVTSSVQYSGSGTISGPSAISTIPPVGTRAGTIIVATPPPEPSYITTTIFLTASDAPETTTVASIPPSGTNPGTIVVGRRAVFVTVVGPYTGTATWHGVRADTDDDGGEVDNGYVQFILDRDFHQHYYLITVEYCVEYCILDKFELVFFQFLIIAFELGFIYKLKLVLKLACWHCHQHTADDVHRFHALYTDEYFLLLLDLVVVLVFVSVVVVVHLSFFIQHFISNFYNKYYHVVVELFLFILKLFIFIFNLSFFVVEQFIHYLLFSDYNHHHNLTVQLFVQLFIQPLFNFFFDFFVKDQHSSSSSSSSSSSTRIVASATRGPAFSCPTTGFLIQTRTLFSLNLASGARTQIADNIGGDTNRNINAMGYNAREEYLYAVSQDSDDYKVIRILANGSTQDVAPIRKLTPNLFNSGDVDENGQYWISTGGLDWYQYNLNPGTAGYGTLVGSGTLAGTGGYTIGDWTDVPGAGGGDLCSSRSFASSAT
ncbi:proline rich protein 5MeD [Colletotrichum higginsianum]|uniref:Proline rich protein 5MeD n=1 Tax=Colletotrichum higginsianum (strain IMI 349063) TaxID=759273 RepID=H1VVF2_COLHI|nr:proline rich protein 5MeD [Colletotrichum higginsianum]